MADPQTTSTTPWAATYSCDECGMRMRLGAGVSEDDAEDYDQQVADHEEWHRARAERDHPAAAAEAATEAEFLGNTTGTLDLDIDAFLRGAVEALQMGSRPRSASTRCPRAACGRSACSTSTSAPSTGTRGAGTPRTAAPQLTRTRIRKSLDAAVLALITGTAR